MSEPLAFAFDDDGAMIPFSRAGSPPHQSGKPTTRCHVPDGMAVTAVWRIGSAVSAGAGLGVRPKLSAKRGSKVNPKHLLSECLR